MWAALFLLSQVGHAQNDGEETLVPIWKLYHTTENVVKKICKFTITPSIFKIFRYSWTLNMLNERRLLNSGGAQNFERVGMFCFCFFFAAHRMRKVRLFDFWMMCVRPFSNLSYPSYLKMSFEAVFQFLSGRIICKETEPWQGTVPHVNGFVQRHQELCHCRWAIKTYNLRIETLKMYC